MANLQNILKIMKQAEIISIGDELLIGQIVNTNASYIAQQLNLLGISVNRVLTIGDTRQAIIEAVSNAIRISDVIIFTGGLGPTNDDITKHTLSEFFESPLKIDEPTLQRISEFFQKRGMPLTAINRQQAAVPECCVVLPNAMGTAPGMWFEKDGSIIISLPGVPFEMQHIFESQVIPKLKALTPQQHIFHKTVLTCGIGESFLSEKIKNWELNLPDFIKLAYLPSPGIVKLRLSAVGTNESDIVNTVNTKIEEVKNIINEYIYGYDDDTMAAVVGKLLKEGNLSLSTAESCTGGYISHLITSVPGSSAYFKGAIIAYSNEIKMQLLQVATDLIQRYGAVSAEVAGAMALGAQRQMQSDFSVACTGIAGPDGGTPEKPVGTVFIAICDARQNVCVEKYLFGDNRERNIIRTGIMALNMLRKKILKNQ